MSRQVAEGEKRVDRLRRLLPCEKLHRMFYIDPDTWDLVWRASHGSKRRLPAGLACRTLTRPNGYLQVNLGFGIGGVRVHEIIWCMVTGDWPDLEIDHVDLNKTHNRVPTNLRLATKHDQSGNVGLRKDNQSGVKGVRWYPKLNKWNANIGMNGRMKNLGYFERKEDAADAYAKAAREHFGEFAREAKGSIR